MATICSRLRQLWRDALGLNRSRDLKRAQSLVQTGHYDEAQRVIDRVLRADPDDQQGQWLRRTPVIAPEADRAERLWDQTRRADAQEVLRQLAERYPNEPEIHLRLAPMLIVAGLYGEAAEHARRAAALAPACVGMNAPRLQLGSSSPLQATRYPDAAVQGMTHDEALCPGSKDTLWVSRC